MVDSYAGLEGATTEMVSMYRVTLPDGRVFEDESETRALLLAQEKLAFDALKDALSMEWGEAPGSALLVSSLKCCASRPKMRASIIRLLQHYDNAAEQGT